MLPASISLKQLHNNEPKVHSLTIHVSYILGGTHLTLIKYLTMVELTTVTYSSPWPNSKCLTNLCEQERINQYLDSLVQDVIPVEIRLTLPSRATFCKVFESKMLDLCLGTWLLVPLPMSLACPPSLWAHHAFCDSWFGIVLPKLGPYSVSIESCRVSLHVLEAKPIC